MTVARGAFDELGVPLEEQARQVKSNRPEVMTVVAARRWSPLFARGVSAVQYGAGTIPTEIDGKETDFDKFRGAAIRGSGTCSAHSARPCSRTRASCCTRHSVIRGAGRARQAVLRRRPRRAARRERPRSHRASSGRPGAGGPASPARSTRPARSSVGSGKESSYASYRGLVDPNDKGYAGRSGKPAPCNAAAPHIGRAAPGGHPPGAARVSVSPTPSDSRRAQACR